MPPVTVYSPWGGLPAPDVRPENVPFLPPVPYNDDGRSALTCANWDDGKCDACGGNERVHPFARCPGWRPRTG